MNAGDSIQIKEFFVTIKTRIKVSENSKYQCDAKNRTETDG